MRAVYRTSFKITGPEEPSALADTVARECWDWLSSKANEPALKDYVAKAYDLMHPRRDEIIQSTNVSHNECKAWGLRYIHPDRTNDSLQWCTELALLDKPEGLFFSCSLLVGRRDGSFVPFRRDATRPSIVARIVRRFICKGAWRLTFAPLPLRENEIQKFLDFLRNPNRTHPVLFISTDATSRYLIPPTPLANQLAGVAYVICGESPQISDSVSRLLGPNLTAYGGAARLYWPEFATTLHPLWKPFRMIQLQERDDGGFGRRVLSLISSVSVSNVHQDFLTWEKLEELGRALAIEEAKGAKDDRELLALYAQDNEGLKARVANLENELREKAQQLYLARQQVKNFKVALDAKGTPPNDRDFADAIAGSVAEAMEYAEDNLCDVLSFALNSKSDGFDSPFQPAGEVLRAFQWLATTYYDARIGKVGCADFDRSIREAIPGWKYSAHQSELTMGNNEEWYLCPWPSAQGGKLQIPEHLKCGQSRRPEETIRIAFAWEPQAKKVVIGFVGQHQENNKS